MSLHSIAAQIRTIMSLDGKKVANYTVEREIRIHMIINGGQEMDWSVIDRELKVVIAKGLIFRC